MRRTQRTMIGVSGIAASVLLHSLLFVAAIWDGGRVSPHPQPPDAVGAGAITGSADGEPGERRIAVMLTSEFAEPAASKAAQLIEPTLQPTSVLEITGTDSLPLPPIEVKISGEEVEAQDAQL